MTKQWMILIYTALTISFVCLTPGCKKEPFNPDELIPDIYNGEAKFTFIDTMITNRVRASIALAGDCYASVKFGEFSFGQPSTEVTISRVQLCEMFGDTVEVIPRVVEGITEPGPVIVRYNFRSGDMRLDGYSIDSTSNSWLIVKNFNATTRLLELEFDFAFRRVNTTPIVENAPPFIRMSSGRLEVTVLDR